MTTNNGINNTLASPFTVGATSVTSTGTQLNYLNGLTAVPINKVATQVFTGSGTYTPTSGMKYCIVELVGGGGGGGGDGTNTLSPGGGGAGYARKLFSAATIGSSQTVTIGAAGGAHSNGGTTSLGALLSATGGNAGSTGGAIGGSGGAGSSGDVNTNGSYGGYAIVPGTAGSPTAISGQGGNSFFGQGAVSVVTAPTDGNNGTGYGAGGSGAWFGTGGSGSGGLIIVTEYISS